ncbi:CRISPR-associated helicase Cas3' [Thermogemmatispora tikiterensis]|uniref:CRISPR-associated helicase Cas3 n=1 Tax=Thermogemmatispora tikiterensis TaxID=1825093 RepID=A0A328VEB4_9CHLR|nr:CRISPR-associated helicase Cas3' [Thermogemmatispora tikiterensis]RAQ94362.1 CRISPR-associated helicase Cas3' [Thermogemmatispora tikiterensis]
MKTLYPYQERVLQVLAQGRNVILVIPTGGGKTLAALLPFLQSCAFNDGTLPGKALYVSPMRVLATQFIRTCRQLLEEELNPLLIEPLRQRYAQFGRSLLSLQTGESPDDPQFESLIIACTIDQLLASALGVPYSVDGARANINVGLLASTYLILDEPHLYPLNRQGQSCFGALTTTIELLRQLKDLTRFIFMSATLSRPLVEQLAQMIDAEVIEASDEELTALAKGRQRVFRRVAEPLSAEQVLARHQRCSLAVCNRVERAQELYLQLDELIQERGLNIRLQLLHSRFSDEDRRRQGEELQRLLGPAAWDEESGRYQGENVIVVATQVVEVGLDISVETLHSELSPANSLIQRAGRCARFPRQQGQVFVYSLPVDDQGQSQTLPYEPEPCQRTWEALAEYDGQVVRFQEERRLLDAVHCESDLQLLARYEEQRPLLLEKMVTSLRKPDPSVRSTLIRDDLQVALLVHDKPEEEIVTAPWHWQLFTLRPSLLQGRHWQALQEQANALGFKWVCKQAVLVDSGSGTAAQGEDDSRREPLYTWEPVTNPAQISSALVLALPQALVTYDRDLGLVFRDGRPPLSARWRQRLEGTHYQSRPQERPSGAASQTVSRQRYEEHIGGLADAYHYGLYHELAYALRRLEERMGVAAGTIDQAIQLALALHDLGKLAEGWQRWARAWERLYHEKKGLHYQEPAADYLFAKTTYNVRAREERQWEQELAERRPNHACESVALARRFIVDCLGATTPASPTAPVVRATCYAIARHHTTGAHEYGASRLAPGALEAVRRALALVQRETPPRPMNLQLILPACQQGDLFPENATSGKFSQPALDLHKPQYETWLAFVMTRALRLADQRADAYR